MRAVEPLGPPNPDPLGLPDMSLMICELMLAFDHLRHEVSVIGYAFCDSDEGVDAAYDRALGVIEEARRRCGARSAAAAATRDRRRRRPDSFSQTA